VHIDAGRTLCNLVRDKRAGGYDSGLRNGLGEVSVTLWYKSVQEEKRKEKQVQGVHPPIGAGPGQHYRAPQKTVHIDAGRTLCNFLDSPGLGCWDSLQTDSNAIEPIPLEN
jgi:hypothetical protein